MIGEEFETDARFRREKAWRSKLEGRPARPRDKKWLQRCLAILKERVAGGYKLPLTFRHSDDRPALAGEWTPTTIGPAQMNPGEAPRNAIFVNRIYKDEDAYRLAKKEFPYTSPELSPDYPEEIDALSHLSEAPFNKFALPEVRELFRVDPFYRSKRAISAQILLGGKIFEKQSVAASGSALGGRGLNEKQEASHMGDNGMGSAIAEAEKGTVGGDVAPASTGPDEILKGLAAKIDALVDLHTKSHGEMMACMKSMIEGKSAKPEMQADAGQGTSEGAMEAGMAGEEAGGSTENMADEEAEKEPGAPSASPAVYRTMKILHRELEKQRAARASDLKTLTEVRGEVLGLRKAQEVIRAEKEQSSLVASAKGRLASMGFALDAESEKELESTAKLGKGHVDALLAGYKRAAEIAGPSVPAYGTFDVVPTDEDDDPEIVELVKKGGEVGRAAKELQRTWRGMSPKDRSFYGDNLKNMLYDRDPTGRPILPSSRNGRG